MEKQRAIQAKNAIGCIFNDGEYYPVEHYKLSELDVRVVQVKGYWYIEIHDWKGKPKSTVLEEPISPPPKNQSNTTSESSV